MCNIQIAEAATVPISYSLKDTSRLIFKSPDFFFFLNQDPSIIPRETKFLDPSLLSRSIQKVNWFCSGQRSILHPSKFRGNPLSSFCINPPTNQPTNKRTRAITKLSRAEVMNCSSAEMSWTTNCDFNIFCSLKNEL